MNNQKAMIGARIPHESKSGDDVNRLKSIVEGV